MAPFADYRRSRRRIGCLEMSIARYERSEMAPRDFNSRTHPGHTGGAAVFDVQDL